MMLLLPLQHALPSEFLLVLFGDVFLIAVVGFLLLLLVFVLVVSSTLVVLCMMLPLMMLSIWR